MPGQPPHIGCNGHAIVVEDHDQRLAAGSGVVEPLKAQSAAHGAVADQGQDAVILSLERTGPGHTQSHRHRVGGVSGNERIMYALPWLGEAGQAAELPQGIKQLPPSGQRLVHIALVPHVEHQPVHGGVKHPVNGYRQLHHPQVGGQVSAGFGYLIQEKTPQLTAKLAGLILVEPLHIGGAVYAV